MRQPTYSLRSPLVIDQFCRIEQIEALRVEADRLYPSREKLDCPEHLTIGHVVELFDNSSPVMSEIRTDIAQRLGVPKLSKFLNGAHSEVRWLETSAFQPGRVSGGELYGYSLVTVFCPLTENKRGASISVGEYVTSPKPGDVFVVNTQRNHYSITPNFDTQEAVFVMFRYAVPIEHVIPL